MKKFFTRTFAALVATFAINASTSAQRTITFNTFNRINFEALTNEVSTIRLTRNFYAGYNTLCLPFSMSAEELQSIMGEGVMLEKLVKAQGGQLTFLDVTEEGIEAGMPYLIYSPKAQFVVFRTSNRGIKTAPITVNVGEASMSGMYAPTQEMNLFGIPAQQETDLLQSILIRTVADKTFLPTRCSISYEGASEVPTILHVTSLGDQTAISQLKAKNMKVDVYTVGGTLVKSGVGMNDAMTTLPKGIYVVNGQKFMVR